MQNDDKQPAVASPIEPVVSSELKEVLYCVDSMCEHFRGRNFGDAEKWIRHLDKAYSDYQETIDE